MKINKNQALYRALPNCWTNYSASDKFDYKYACEVTVWNTKRVYGINENIIKDSIRRRVKSFDVAGGEVKEEFSDNAIDNFEFVEAAMNDGVPDILCKINPQTYYCQDCGTVVYKPKAKSAPYCEECSKKTGKKVRTNQLQMVYVCECGYADGVKPPKNDGSLKFYPKDSSDKHSQFRFQTKSGAIVQMRTQCPVCTKQIYPRNAFDTTLFYSQNGSIVNLYNVKYAELLKKYQDDAEILMFAKWFNLISNDKFLQILEDPKDFFEHKSKEPNDPQIIQLAKSLNITPEALIAAFDQSEVDADCINKIKNEIDSIIPLSTFSCDELKLITANLMEFDTLKYPLGIISLEEAIEKNIEIGNIVDENDIDILINKMHINKIQISEQVEMVNYAYGYTRRKSCPDGNGEGEMIRLRGFNNKVFTTILNTEGILVEFDMLAIYKWLVENDIVDDSIVINTLEEAKKWFIENVKLSKITHYNTISATENIVTKAVYSLLHTMAHMMIISAGKHSGISRDSISEIIFANTCSIFIYPTSSEGVTLGSISGMFETELRLFLEDALKDNEICTFDPVCMKNQNGACVACAYLSEVNCTHFNKDLSRAYLYGGKIAKNSEEIIIKKGFWK